MLEQPAGYTENKEITFDRKLPHEPFAPPERDSEAINRVVEADVWVFLGGCTYLSASFSSWTRSASVAFSFVTLPPRGLNVLMAISLCSFNCSCSSSGSTKALVCSSISFCHANGCNDSAVRRMHFSACRRCGHVHTFCGQVMPHWNAARCRAWFQVKYNG